MSKQHKAVSTLLLYKNRITFQKLDYKRSYNLAFV